jgi:hypothetical protein
MTERGRAIEVPKDPLNKVERTVAKLFDAFRIAFHVEFGNDDVLQFDKDVLEISKLS